MKTTTTKVSGLFLIVSLFSGLALLNAAENEKNVLTPEIIAKAKELHGHTCPGLCIGFRAAEWVAREFETGKPENRLIAVSEIGMCGVDAFQIVLDCTAGKGNMIVKNSYGKHAFNFYRPRDGKKVRLLWKMKETPEFQKKMQSINSDDPKARNTAMQEYIMSAPFDDLFVVQEPLEEMPDIKRTKKDIPCSFCGEGVETLLIKEKDGKKICVPCLAKQQSGQNNISISP
ncbi:MAG: formylmethanofuran dehydrogenase subunit E family protein [Planctomycetaceae bacterium]|jgi:formylmethanofuran dehydrogenase subunit E|nr:formylmethanofuran dehydrogenase subunit E family protein [Planctomycetaceae bacterium]